MNLKTRIFGILEPGDEDSKYFDPFIMGLIVLNVAAVVLETVDWIYMPVTRGSFVPSMYFPWPSSQLNTSCASGAAPKIPNSKIRFAAGCNILMTPMAIG